MLARSASEHRLPEGADRSRRAIEGTACGQNGTYLIGRLRGHSVTKLVGQSPTNCDGPYAGRAHPAAYLRQHPVGLGRGVCIVVLIVFRNCPELREVIFTSALRIDRSVNVA